MKQIQSTFVIFQLIFRNEMAVLRNEEGFEATLDNNQISTVSNNSTNFSRFYNKSMIRNIQINLLKTLTV